MRLAIAILVLATSCRSHGPHGQGSAGASCSANASACAADGAFLACRDGVYAVAHGCRGPLGCRVDPDGTPSCDQSIVAVGDPCDEPGQCGCNAAHTRVMCCGGATIAPAFFCRGPSGCRIDGATYSCDESIGVEGEDCRGGSCSADGQWVLSCEPVAADLAAGRTRATLQKQQACEPPARCVYDAMIEGHGTPSCK